MRWLVGFWIFPYLAVAQSHSVSVEYNLGETLPIYNNFPSSTGTHAIALGYSKTNDTTNIASKLWCLPETGFSLTLFDFGNPNILGQAVGFQYQLGKKVVATKKSTLLFMAKLGGVYFNKPFHYLNNPENIVIGSNFAFWVGIHWQYQYRLSQRLSLLGSFNMYHSSNGHTNLPNVGYNIPMLGIGGKYHLEKGGHRFIQKEAKEIRQKARNNFNKLGEWKRQAKLSLGMNEFGGTTSPVNGPKYFFYLGSFSFIKRVKYNGAFQVGLEGYYSEEQRIYLESESHIAPPSTFTNASALLGFIGYEFYYKHFSMTIQGGYYLHNPFDRWAADYQDVEKLGEKLKTHVPGKFGAKYHLKDKYTGKGINPFLGVFVKSNMGQADFLEVGLGAQF